MNSSMAASAENDLPIQTIVEAISLRLHKVTGDKSLLKHLDWFKERNEALKNKVAPIVRKPFFVLDAHIIPP